MGIRKPAVAGAFYPKDKNELNKIIISYLEKAEYKNIKNIRAIIVPHAGYIYSGKVATQAYKQIKNFKDVILIGPCHYYYADISVSPLDFETPLGTVRNTNKIKEFPYIEKAHTKEHSLEVQLPFLQIKLENFTITPILLGNINPEELANKLNKYLTKNTLIVISSDLSHFRTYEEAKKIDKETINKILNFDFNLNSESACGLIPILTLMHLAKINNWKPVLLDYKNSGDVIPIRDSVVGYASIIYHE